MNQIIDLARHRALAHQARQLEADALAARGKDRAEILRDAIATRARMLELERGVA